jgi:C_GCAxxG_C_C family probable redox protein
MKFYSEGDQMISSDVVKKAGELAMYYKSQKFHCSESIIRACSDALGLRLPEDVIRVASGFRGGGGGYWDRCGVIESGIILISYLYGRLTVYQDSWDYSYLIRELHKRFNNEFHSIYCRDIKGTSANKNCDDIYRIGSEIIVQLLIEAPVLLSNLSEEEKNI